jgi:hypothetical protein
MCICHPLEPIDKYAPSLSVFSQDLGILKGRLNLEYTASTQPSQMHRALQIISATSELSGEYKCSVSTFHDEDFMVKRMLIFGE